MNSARKASMSLAERRAKARRKSAAYARGYGIGIGCAVVFSVLGSCAITALVIGILVRVFQALGN